MKNFILLVVAICTFLACNTSKTTTETSAKEVAPPAAKEAVNATSKQLSFVPKEEFPTEKAPKNYKADRTQPGDSLIISYIKTPCFGTCPHFELHIYKSGYALYHGKNFVDNKGKFEAFYSKEEMAMIIENAKAINFFQMENEYDNKGISDLPSTIIKINDGVFTKQVLNRVNGPASLMELNMLLDNFIRNKTWTNKK